MPTRYDLLRLKKVWKLTASTQIVLIWFLFLFRAVQAYTSQATLIQKLPKLVIIFAPIYEEVIFRGLVLMFLFKYINRTKSIILSSVLFGLWHLKNYSHLDSFTLLYQVGYAIIFIGPILAYVATKTKTIWVGVILHYTNNIIAPLFSII